MAETYARIVDALKNGLDAREENGALCWDGDKQVWAFVDQGSDVLTIAHVVSIAIDDEVATLRTSKNETFIFRASALAGWRIQAEGEPARGGQAGFMR